MGDLDTQTAVIDEKLLGVTSRPPIHALVANPAPLDIAIHAERAFLDRAELASDQALTRKARKNTRLFEIDALTKARYIELALMCFSGGMTRQKIATKLGISTAKLSQDMSDPQFKAVYDDTYQEIYGSIENTLASERADPIRRSMSLAIRGQTLIAETLNLLRERIAEHHGGGTRMNAQELRACIDASKVTYDQSPLGAHIRAQGNAQTHTHSFKPSDKQMTTLTDTIKEAGIDISDLMGDIVDAEIVDNEPTTIEGGESSSLDRL